MTCIPYWAGGEGGSGAAALASILAPNATPSCAAPRSATRNTTHRRHSEVYGFDPLAKLLDDLAYSILDRMYRPR